MSVGLVAAVHGFLGEASDWSEVRKHSMTGLEWICPDLFKADSQKDLNLSATSENLKKVFLGYSYGGRLGLSLLSETPDLFDHYFFISVNPGFKDEDSTGRTERAEQDLGWAQRISNEGWNLFLQDWNAQAVFKDSKVEPFRNAEDFDPGKLKYALLEKSLARQPDCRDVIKENKNKITWVSGIKDTKFMGIAQEMLQRSIIQNSITVDSGHRVLFDNPKAIADLINNYFGSQ